MGRYVTTTYRLRELHMCVQSEYVPTNYTKYKQKRYMFENESIGLKVM